MLKSFLLAAAIMIASPAFVSAQDIFWSFSLTEVQDTGSFLESGSVYIFSDGLFGFDALDLNFTTSDSNVIQFTGGEAFNPEFTLVGKTRFDSSVISIDAEGSSGNLFAVNVAQNGVNIALGPLFDPGFCPAVAPNGAVLLARVDFEIVRFGSSVDLEFALGPQGVLQLPDNVINPSFGSATVETVGLKLGYCIGDVNLSGDFELNYVGSVNSHDIAPFIAILSSGSYQFEADCNGDGVVDFLDIAPFIVILARN